MQLPEPEEHGKSIFSLFWPRNMTGFPLVLKIERAVTENFGLQIWRFDSGMVELTKEHSGMAIRAE